MRTTLTIAAIIIALTLVAPPPVPAFWWGSPRDDQSGLDLAGGFDVKTVVTVSGTVVTPPAPREKSSHTEMTLQGESGDYTVILGPWSYWQTLGVTIDKGERLVVTGSRAEGKEGKVYLFAQTIDRPQRERARITLRDPYGKPAWSRSGTGTHSGEYPGPGSGDGYRYRGGNMGGRRR